jgi:hypothetical protein
MPFLKQIPIDVQAHLQEHRRHVLTSADRLARSNVAYAAMQARIQASVALIERARTSKWPMNLPTFETGLSEQAIGD